ncbi:hypothetical protein DL93DRAFT_2151742 [Clavulina sp. PMI_390]|nr:hypothetical protein DL93DRAFT_2151742 [Clavulina sp. PMI_390]
MYQVSLKATTFLAPTSRSLLQALRTRLHAPPHRTHIVFSLSLNANEEALNTIPKLWENSIGCVTAPWPSHSRNTISCAVLEVPFGVGNTFVSTIPGRPPVQVGRYHSLRRSTSDEEYDSSALSYNLAMQETSGPKREMQHPIPEGLNPIVQNMQSFLYFSDLAPEGLTASLDYYYPQSLKSGLLASSTPFITGHPVTMFANGRTITSGAVGIGMFPQFEGLEHGYDGLESLSEPLKVTSSQGNLVHTLDGTNPSKLLTSAIASATSTSKSTWAPNPKDEDFYLGVLSANGENFEKVYTIMSGDPSRGSLALDGEESPAVGSLVKLLRRPESESAAIGSNLATKAKSATFFNSSKDIIFAAEEEGISSTENGVTIIEDAFLAASENGLLLSKPASGPRTWKSSVEGGWSSMSWHVPPPPA